MFSLKTPGFLRPFELRLPFVLLPPFLLRPHTFTACTPSPTRLSGWHRVGKDFNEIKLDGCQAGRPGVSGELSPSLCSVSLVHFTSPHLNIVISVLPLPSLSQLLGLSFFFRGFLSKHIIMTNRVKIRLMVQHTHPWRALQETCVMSGLVHKQKLTNGTCCVKPPLWPQMTMKMVRKILEGCQWAPLTFVWKEKS